jgi:hypothetical protein
MKVFWKSRRSAMSIFPSHLACSSDREVAARFAPISANYGDSAGLHPVLETR